jgi:hypothetical protein
MKNFIEMKIMYRVVMQSFNFKNYIALLIC